MTSTTSVPSSGQEAMEVRTENLFQRTEVLAGMCQHTPVLFFLVKTTYRDVSGTTDRKSIQQQRSPTLLRVDYSAGVFLKSPLISVANI